MASYKNLARSGNEYARVLPGTEGGFRGVDFSSAPNRVATYRLADCQNMYRDYKSADGGALETVPGFRRIRSFKGKIHGTHHWRDAVGVEHLVIHAGDALWIADEANRDDSEAWVKVDGNVADAPSKAFCYNGFFYLLDGVAYQRLTLDEEGKASLVPVTDIAYVPTPILNGEEYEQRNATTDTVIFSAKWSEVDVDKCVGFCTKRDTFFVCEKPDFSHYRYSGARFVAVHAKEGDVITGDGENSGFSHVAVLLNGEQIKWDAKALMKCQNLHSLYLMRNKERNIGSIVFPKEGVLPVSEAIYYGFPASEFYNLCGDGHEAPNVGYVSDAMRFLPPNIVLSPGESVLLNDVCYNVESGTDSPPYREGVIVGREYCDSPEYLECAIHIDSDENGFVRVTAGASVQLGNYGYCGYIRGSEGSVYGVYRIKVVGQGEEKKPVRDVFNYNATPQKVETPFEVSDVAMVQCGEESVGHGVIYGDNNRTAYVCAMIPEDKDVHVTVTASPYHFSTAAGAELTSKEAINGCRLCAVFDNRVFLAGNPALPNTVFYSMVDDPTYFGVLNYFNEGGGFECVTALLPFSDTLAVCKEDKLYYRCAADGTDNLLPRVYVGKQGSLGLGCLGACCNFLDDPVFLTKEGVWGLNKADVTLERALGRRSGNVDTRLLTEANLRSAEMVEWDGWLCLFVNGNVYMADSRAVFSDSAGNAQYEWFYLTGVGVWKDVNVRTPYYAAVTGDAECDGRILNDGAHKVNGLPIGRTESEGQYSAGDVYFGIVDGISVEYVVRGEKAFLVFPTSEYEKIGTFLPVKHPLVVEDRLYFGNDDGDLYVVNNDRRGKAVDGEDVESDELHRSCYSFDGHRIDAGFVTGQDDCGVPHLTKSTSHRSLTVRAKLMDNGGFAMSVYTERKPSYCEIVTASPHNFYAADFGSTSYHQARSAVIVGREQEKRWVEKQYLFRDGGFCRPFGIYSVAYRYRIAGRIRER